jgi:hypothetical protein
MIHDFKPDMKVSFISNDGTAKSGTIIAAHDFAHTAIIRADDGEIQKIPYDCLFVEKKPEREEKPREDVRTIRKDDFVAALHKVTTPESMVGAENVDKVDPSALSIHSLAIFLAGMMIVRKLYDEAEEVVTNREDLVHFILVNCAPSKLGEASDMSPDTLVSLGVECALIVPRVIPILFGDTGD